MEGWFVSNIGNGMDEKENGRDTQNGMDNAT